MLYEGEKARCDYLSLHGMSIEGKEWWSAVSLSQIYPLSHTSHTSCTVQALRANLANLTAADWLIPTPGQPLWNRKHKRDLCLARPLYKVYC